MGGDGKGRICGFEETIGFSGAAFPMACFGRFFCGGVVFGGGVWGVARSVTLGDGSSYGSRPTFRSLRLRASRPAVPPYALFRVPGRNHLWAGEDRKGGEGEGRGRERGRGGGEG